MIQQINLHQSLYGEADGRPSAIDLVQITLAALAFMLVWYAVEKLRTSFAEDELEHWESVRQKQMDRVAKLRIKYKVGEEDQSLADEVEGLKGELDAKRVLLSNLSTQAQGSKDGFSLHLEGLARQRVQGLWLSHIHVTNGGSNVALNGFTLKPQFVPRLLQLLSEEAAFKGQEFTSFELSRPTATASEPDEPRQVGNIGFSLSSEPKREVR